MCSQQLGLFDFFKAAMQCTDRCSACVGQCNFCIRGMIYLIACLVMVITDDGYRLVSILLISRVLSWQKCFMDKYFDLYVKDSWLNPNCYLYKL